jgi:hypothetical protein
MIRSADMVGFGIQQSMTTTWSAPPTLKTLDVNLSTASTVARAVLSEPAKPSYLWRAKR